MLARKRPEDDITDDVSLWESEGGLVIDDTDESEDEPVKAG